MTRIEPVGNTLHNYAAAVAGADNVVSEQESSENGLPAPRDIPQIDDDPAASALELEAYLLGMASSHSQTITIDNVDYAVTGLDSTIASACQTSAVDVRAVRRMVQLIQMVMEINRGLFEVTDGWTVEGDPENEASCADFAYSAATDQLINELSEDPDPMGRRPALADINIRAIAIRSGALSRPLINELFGTSGRTDVGAREGALQSLLGIGAIGDLPDPARIDELISKLNSMIGNLEAGSSYLPVLNDLLIFAQILKVASQADTYIGILFGLDEQGQDQLAERTVGLFSETVGTRLTANPSNRPDMAMVLSDMISALRSALLQLTAGCQSILPPLPEVDGSDVVAWDSAWSGWAADAERALNAQVRTTLPPIAQGTTEAEIVFTPMFVNDINSITPAMIAIVDAATGQPVAGIQVTAVSVDGDRLKVSLTIDEGVSLGNYSIRLTGVGSWYRPQMNVTSSVSVDLVMTPEPQDIEVAGFTIIEPQSPADLEAVRQAAAAVRAAEAPVEERWIDAGQGVGLEYSVSAYGGVGFTDGVDLDVVGLADGETATPTAGAEFEGSYSFLVDNYRFRLGLLSRGLYAGGDGEEAPETGLFSLAASLTGANLFPSFYPDFSLGFGYRHLWNDGETPSHPAGDELSVGLGVDEVFPLSSQVGLGITTGMEAAWSVGDSRYGWERYDVPVGARLRFSSSDANLDLALGYLYRSQTMRERAGEGFGEHTTNIDGNAFFLDTTIETGGTAGNYGFSALYLDNPETVDVDFRYRYPFSWGSVGGSVGYESEDYLGPVVTRVPISVSAEGEVTPGVDLFGRLEGGPLWLDTPEGAVEPDQSGGYFGLTVGARMGSRSSLTEDLIDVAPTASAARLAEDSARDINNAIALRYLLAFKMGLLDENYELDEDALPPNIEAAYTEADARGPYGYGSGAAGGGTLMPPRGGSVSLGDVAPVVCYLGVNPLLAGIEVDNYTPIDAQYRDDFEDQLYVFEGRGDKQRVLNVGQCRHAVSSDEGIAVDGVHEGTTLAGDLLGAVMVLAEDVEHHISRAGVEFFLGLLHNWEELGAYFGGTREEFIEQLLTELRGEVVGHAVMAVAKWVLGVSDLESLDESQVEQVMAKAYDLRLSMLREPEATPAEEAPAVEPEAPAVTEEPEIVPAPAEDLAPEVPVEERTI